MASFPITRLHRLRGSSALRDLVAETDLAITHFIYPLFISETIAKPQEISAMPGIKQWTVRTVAEEAQRAYDLGIPAVLLFGIPEKKDAVGSEAYHKKGVIQRAIREIKTNVPEILIITDVCLCEYTDHGHCGIIQNNSVQNDPTLDLLSAMALSHVQAGADIVAPSDMMDGRVGALRKALDKNGYEEVPIMAYSAKYASGFYGPFREAAQSAPQFGDRKTYQMDPRNSREAIREVEMDIDEGADMIMVKPALSYLDVITRVKQQFDLPLAAYNVSGEYSMIKAAAANGWIDEKRIVLETLNSIKRAGADIIISYFAPQVAEWLKQDQEVRSSDLNLTKNFTANISTATHSKQQKVNSKKKKIAVILMTYGSPKTLDEVPQYLKNVYGGRDASPDNINEFQRRYDLIGGSPLIEITQNQAAALGKELNKQIKNMDFTVDAGMRFSHPFIDEVVPNFVNADEIVGIIMSPQYSPIIMSGYNKELRAAIEKLKDPGVRLKIAEDWHLEPYFIEALAEKVKLGLKKFPAKVRKTVPVLFSAHSMPKRVIDKEPNYIDDLKETAAEVAKLAGLPEDRWMFCYQSAGHTPEEWLKPDFADIMRELEAKGQKNVLIAPVQFLADHLEILYDVGIGAREQAEEHGIHFERTDSLNTSPLFIKALAEIVKNQINL